jgi:hypothetical protein
VLAEVAASAPEELVATLRAAPPAVQESALGTLAGGIGRSDDPEHPFRAAVVALGAKDGEVAAFARALVPRLDAALKAGEAIRAQPTLVPASATPAKPATPPAEAAPPAPAPTVVPAGQPPAPAHHAR